MEQVAQPRMPERRLAQLNAELRAEEPLDVGQGHASEIRGCAIEDAPQAMSGVVQRSNWQHLPLARCRHISDGQLQRRAALFQDGLRLVVRYYLAVAIAEDLPARNRELHDVADLAQGPVFKEGQTEGRQGERASIAATRQAPVLASGVAATELFGHGLPELLGVGIVGAASIHKGGRPSHERGHVLAAVRGLHAHDPATLADAAQAGFVDVRHSTERQALTHQAHEVRAAHTPRHGTFAEPLQQNAAEGLELVDV
mmetsp:Transcript_139301/g.445386  ORF Transcript_139301/g.445386 Transcript_139301/m.445386 type:complete len:256 (+) Transcript_139301:1217-1984(+)